MKSVEVHAPTMAFQLHGPLSSIQKHAQTQNLICDALS